MTLQELKKHFQVSFSNDESSFYFHTGDFHTKRCIYITNMNGHQLVFSASISGCGLVVAKGTCNLSRWKTDDLDKIWQYLSYIKVGAVLATGNRNIPEKTMTDHGFEKVTQFNNWYDGPEWIQDIYVKKIPRFTGTHENKNI